MAKILEMAEQKRRLTAKKAFREWTRRFSMVFDTETSLEDLDDTVLAALIPGGDDASGIYYEFAMGVMGFDPGAGFHSLTGHDKMAVMDVGLFILDQTRFEAMRRLGWVTDHPFHHLPLIELVEQFRNDPAHIRQEAPTLSPNHPRYADYMKTFDFDRCVFIRKLIPGAIAAFRAGTTNAE